jgi:PqqD family protein of HPr-rel-A system
MTWRALPTPLQSLYCWDDECVVFNQLSGDTHLLSASAGRILLQLQQVGMPVDGWTEAAMLRGAMAPQSDQAPECALEEILAELNALALIECA